MNSLTYRYSLSKTSSLIYFTFLIGIILILVSLPYLKTTIAIKSQGLFQSALEKTNLTIPVNGVIKSIKLLDNQKTVVDDTLIVIDASLPEQEKNIVSERINLLKNSLQDLRVLINHTKSNQTFVPNLITNQYQAEWQAYDQELNNALLAKQQAQSIFARYEKLYKGGVLTSAEYEKYRFDYDQALNNCLLLTKKYNSQWQTDLNQYKEELRQLSAKTLQIGEQKKLYVLKAPVKGTLQNITGLQNGTYVFANQKIGEISPDTKLTAYCYIKPSDIGLINKGQSVRFNIDAFNYNQWGFVTGKVLDISDDILIADNQPVFKVKCSLDTDFLQLKNGYKGYLKKGMTFNARFIVTERTLYQLLYDKVDDWVNPNLAAK